MNSITEIIRAYTEGNASLKETNAALEAAAAGFHLSPREETGWTEAEMREGFIQPPAGEAKKAKPDGPDMRRRVDLAGKNVIQATKMGLYGVTYDEDGYAVAAKSI